MIYLQVYASIRLTCYSCIYSSLLLSGILKSCMLTLFKSPWVPRSSNQTLYSRLRSNLTHTTYNSITNYCACANIAVGGAQSMWMLTMFAVRLWRSRTSHVAHLCVFSTSTSTVPTAGHHTPLPLSKFNQPRRETALLERSGLLLQWEQLV